MKSLKIKETDFSKVELTQAQLKRVDEVFDEAVKLLLDGNVKNVVGVFKGHKWVKGEAKAEACIQVHVVEKVSHENLERSDMIPNTIGGVKTDVIEVGEVTFSQNVARVRPLQSGYSIGATHNAVNSTGTLGAFTLEEIEGQAHYCVLSNNHVLAHFNNFPIGTEVMQPGPHDGGGAPDICGQLSAFIPLSTNQDNLVDAALASIEEGLIPADRGYVANVVSSGDIKAGMEVEKKGRSTDVTAGVVLSIGTINVPDGTNTYKMVDQIFSSYSQAGGDSGSLVVRVSDRHAVGLHFAGSATVSYANKIENVLNALNVALY